MTAPKFNLPVSNSQLKICVLGTRGFPNIQGGVETHCENLYPELVNLACETTVFTREPYVTSKSTNYRDVKLVPLKCPKKKHLEALIHTFKGVIAARKLKPDILHLHTIGPALLTPLARILGMKVVITHHGPDYKRKKWGRFAKLILKLGELSGVIFANEVIAISNNIAEDLRKKFKRQDISVIPNGVIIPKLLSTDTTLKKYFLEKNKYILSVGRFVPEKGFHDLIDAFQLMQDERVRVQGKVSRLKDDCQLETVNWKLVIVGEADHEDSYSNELKEKARKCKNIVLTGFLTGEPLQELYSNAALFVLASYHEGLPIVLLEAMSYGLSCIASDIPANRNLELANDRYFRTGNTRLLYKKMKEFTDRHFLENEKREQLQKIAENYNWLQIASRTLAVYEKGIHS